MLDHVSKGLPTPMLQEVTALAFSIPWAPEMPGAYIGKLLERLYRACQTSQNAKRP